MSRDNYLYVHFKDTLVGTLALTSDHKAAFEYSDEWLKNGFPISPFSLSLEKKVFVPTKSDIENMFRRMCFNVFAHNRDDHSKNFTYLYDDEKDIWHLSPAYDLTYSKLIRKRYKIPY